MTQLEIIMEHIMAPGGWKSSAMAKRYARVNPVHLQKYANRLEELAGIDYRVFVGPQTIT